LRRKEKEKEREKRKRVFRSATNKDESLR